VRRAVERAISVSPLGRSVCPTVASVGIVERRRSAALKASVSCRGMRYMEHPARAQESVWEGSASLSRRLGLRGAALEAVSRTLTVVRERAAVCWATTLSASRTAQRLRAAERAISVTLTGTSVYLTAAWAGTALTWSALRRMAAVSPHRAHGRLESSVQTSGNALRASASLSGVRDTAPVTASAMRSVEQREFAAFWKGWAFV